LFANFDPPSLSYFSAYSKYISSFYADSSLPENYSVLCAFLFTLELSTPLESGERVLSAYEIAFLDMVSLQQKEQNYFVLCAFDTNNWWEL